MTGVIFLPCTGAYLVASPLLGKLGNKIGRFVPEIFHFSPTVQLIPANRNHFKCLLTLNIIRNSVLAYGESDYLRYLSIEW